jgi:hypothetical protein
MLNTVYIANKQIRFVTDQNKFLTYLVVLVLAASMQRKLQVRQNVSWKLRLGDQVPFLLVV